MPEETVYKILLDDVEAQRVLASIDARIESLARAADGHFQNVGRGMAAGLRQATQQAQQATRQVQQSEQQTARTVEQSQRRTATAARQAGEQRVRAATQAGQAETAAARQSAQAHQQSISAIEQEIEQLRRLRSAAEEAARVQQERVAQAQQTFRTDLSQQLQEQTRLQALQARGAPPEILEPQKGRLAEAEAGTLASERQVSIEQEGLERAQAQIQEYEQAIQSASATRQQMAQVAAESAAQQAAAEQGLSEAARSSAQEQIAGLQEQATAARQNADQRQQILAQAREELDFLRQRKLAENDALLAQSEAASKAADAVVHAAEEKKAAEADLVEVRKTGEADAIAAAERQVALAGDQVKVAKERLEAETTAEEERKKVVTGTEREIKQAVIDRRAAQRESTEANKQAAAVEKQLTLAKRELANQEKAAAKNQRDAAREFRQTTKTYAEQRNALNELAQRYGSFTVVIGKSADEMNDLEKEVNDVIRSNKQLSDSIDEIVRKRGQFQFSANRGTFAGGPNLGFSGTQLRQAGFAAQRIGVPGNFAALGEAAAVGGAAGVAIAGVLLTTKALIDAMKTLGSLALETFENIVRGATEAAKELELAEAQFNAFFQGDTEAAAAALTRLRQLSIELGQNVIGVGRAFLPEVESLDQLEQVVKIATALARFQPEQGQLGARIALQEALSGEFRSLQRRFEISPVAIDRIREAFEQSGVTGFLTELQAELERTGRSVEDLSDTFGVALGQVQERLRQISGELGAPIIEEVGDQFRAVDDILEDLQPDLTAVANAFGEVLAKLAEIIGSEVQSFLESFDPDPLYEVAEALFRVVDAFGILVTGANAGEGAADALESGLLSLAGLLLRVEGFFLRTAISIAETREQLKKTLPLLRAIGDAASNQFLLQLTGVPANVADDLAAVNHAIAGMGESFLESGTDLEVLLQRMEEHNQAADEFAEMIRNWGSALDESSEAGEDAANRFLKASDAIAELENIQTSYIEVQEKVNEAVREFDIEANLRFEKLLTDATRKRLDAEIQNAEKLIDIETKNRQKIADIRTSYDQNIIKAGVDLGDKEADIARKNGRAMADLEEDLNEERLKVEDDYLERLQRLRDKFNFDAFEAILANDGKRLRQIRRRQAFEESQLKKNRDNELDDVEDRGKKRRQELQKQLERELEDARIANARKIRDLATSLQDQLAKQEEARRREVEAQAVAEQRKRADLQDELNRGLTDYTDWWNERARITAEKSAEDLAQMQQYVLDAMEIMQQLSRQGITFDPLTGRPVRQFSTQQIDTTPPESVQHIQQLVFELQATQDRLAGLERTPEELREFIESLSIPDLVELFDKLKTSVDLAQVQPGADIFTLLERYAIDTTDLASKLLMDQALDLGSQVGISAQKIVDDTLGLSMTELQKWVDNFIEKYSVDELPDFSIFGPGFPGSVLGTAGPMSVVAPGTPGAPFLIPPGPQSTLPGTTAPTGAGIFTPGTTFGQPTFVLPGVTELPGFTLGGEQGGWTGYPATGLTQVPTFGQAITANPQQLPGMFGGGLFAPNPALGFDAQAFQDMLQSQVDAQLAAELVKRGEIEDTADFAALLTEQQSIDVANMLQEQIDNFQATSDAEIAILEQTIAKQEETLRKLRQDPALEDEAEAVEAALVILNDALERKRQELADATQAILDQETAAAKVAEDEKQEAIEETAQTASEKAISKAQDVEAGVSDEVTSVQTGEDDKTTALTEGTQERSQLEQGFRREQIEADAIHQEERAEQADDAFLNMVNMANEFWHQWISENERGINADLQQLQHWLVARQQIINNAITTIPGSNGSTLPSVGGGTTTNPNQVTEAELENLAISLADQLNILTPTLRGDIMDMGYQELLDFVASLQEQLGIYAFGGGFLPGRPMIVGERGPELVEFGAAGRVVPTRDLIMRNQAVTGVDSVGTIINQNLEMVNTFPDPRGLPPSYVRQIENMIAKAVKRGWSGG